MTSSTDRQPIRTFPRSEFRVETLRGSGPGGQHRNKTESCVRITHIPTGFVGEACEHRSQHRNRALAFERVAAKVIDHHYPNRPRERAPAGQTEIRAYKLDDDRVVDAVAGQFSARHVTRNGLDPLLTARLRARSQA